MLRNILLLAVCQALMLTATSLTMSSSALVGVQLAPRPVLATLPLGLTYLAVMGALIPASLSMRRYGRRVGFATGGLCALLAGAMMSWGIYHHHFLVFSVGSVFMGFAMAYGQFLRFAAAEVASEDYKSRAISWVLAGGIVAAFAGPGIATLTRQSWQGPAFSASFAALIAVGFSIMLIQLFLKIPPTPSSEKSGPRRSWNQVYLQPAFLVAVLSGMIAYGSMNLLMVATPLAMDHQGMKFSSTATVIQWHIVGMFAPSFFTGHLIRRYGVLNIMLIGALMLLVTVAASLSGQSFLHFVVGLVFLGLGWNFLFVGSTTLLTETYLPAEKSTVQGVNDFLVFSVVAFTAMTSGLLHHIMGWEALNLIVMPAIAVAIISILWLKMRGYVAASLHQVQARTDG
ncbi:MAG: MFS transporter [Pseudomonadota bacterium]